MRIYRIFVFGCPRIVRASSRARCIVRGAAAAQASAPASLPVQPTAPPLSPARPPAFPYRRLACSHPACLPGPLQMPIGAPTHASVRMGGFTRVWSERESAVGPVRPTFFSAASRHCEPRRLGSAAPVGATQSTDEAASTDLAVGLSASGRLSTPQPPRRQRAFLIVSPALLAIPALLQLDRHLTPFLLPPSRFSSIALDTPATVSIVHTRTNTGC